MAVHTSYYRSVVDVSLQRLLEQSPDARSDRKRLTLVTVFLISAAVVALVLWGMFMAADFALRSAADVYANR
jgi:hypothetical protein